MQVVMLLLRDFYTWYLAHKGPFEVAATACSFIGITFALFSIHDGRKLTRDLGAIFNHLTTREAGTYPSYMRDVEKLISEARDYVVIACDFPGYGAWVDRGHYSTYMKALENQDGIDLNQVVASGLLSAVGFDGATVDRAIAHWEGEFAEVLSHGESVIRHVGEMATVRRMSGSCAL